MLQCDCGFEARAEQDDELVTAVQRHAWKAHGMTLSDDEALLLVFRAGLDAHGMPAVPHHTAARPDEEET